RLPEPSDLRLVQLRRERKRREPCAMEDLVRPRAPDARDRPLVAEERVQAARITPEDLRQLLPEAERLRPEVLELLLGLLRRQEPDTGPFLRTGLGEHQLGAALEPQPESGRLRAVLAGAQVPQPAGAHQEIGRASCRERVEDR